MLYYMGTKLGQRASAAYYMCSNCEINYINWNYAQIYLRPQSKNIKLPKMYKIECLWIEPVITNRIVKYETLFPTKLYNNLDNLGRGVPTLQGGTYTTNGHTMLSTCYILQGNALLWMMPSMTIMPVNMTLNLPNTFHYFSQTLGGYVHYTFLATV